MPPRIVVLEAGSLPSSVTLRRPAQAHEWAEYSATAPDQVVERLRGATVAIINKVPVRRDALDALPDLRMIAVSATGTDCVDVAVCRERGIVVSNVQGYATRTVPEHAMALILALRRNLIGFVDAVRRGDWQKTDQFCLFTHPVRDLHGSRIGIVGAGSIGRSVGRLAAAFGMEVVYHDRPEIAASVPGWIPFDELLATSDVITLHCPLTEETRNLIALPQFRAMARRPLLINTARGGLVDERDLVTALEEGLISGAAFDVLSAEPPPADHILLGLTDRPNFILTPHVAWSSHEAVQALADQCIDHVENFLRGRPSNNVAA